MPNFYSLSFDGVDDRCSSGAAAVNFSTLSASRALSCWVKTTTTNKPLLAYGASTPAGREYVLSLDGSGRVSVDMTGYTNIAGATPINDNAWHLATAVYSNPSIISGDTFSALFSTAANGTADIPFDFDSSLFSFACWVRPTDFTSSVGSPMIFTSDGIGGAALGFSTGGALAFGKINISEVYSTGTIPANKWSHVAYTYDGANIEFYINGTLDSTVAYTETFTGASNYAFGGRTASGFNYANMALDYAYHVPAVLTSGEVATLAAGGEPALSYDGKWFFNEGSGTTIADTSGNGYSATMNAAVTWVADVPGSNNTYIYVDGTLDATSNSEQSPLTSDNDIALGADTALASFFTGQLYRPLVYNTTITGGEVATLSTCGAVPTTGLVMQINMEEGSGTTLNDSSVENNDLTIIDGTWTLGNACFAAPSTFRSIIVVS